MYTGRFWKEIFVPKEQVKEQFSNTWENFTAIRYAYFYVLK